MKGSKDDIVAVGGRTGRTGFSVALRGRSPGEEPATVRNLLTHTGGLPREAPFMSWMENRFPTREQIEESVPAAVCV